MKGKRDAITEFRVPLSSAALKVSEPAFPQRLATSLRALQLFASFCLRHAPCSLPQALPSHCSMPTSCL